MVLMSIKVPSDENVIRSRNENGNCLINGDSVIIPVKWKSRNVSSVRDFPQGCGLNLQAVNTIIREHEPPLFPLHLRCNSNNVENSGVSDKKAQLNLDSLVSTEVEYGDNGHLNAVFCKSDNVDNDAASDEKMGSNMETLANTELKSGIDKKVGPNQDSLVNTEVKNGDNSREEKLEWTVASLVNTEMKNEENGAVNTGVDLKVISLKLKFCRRRVSAVRDFPPFCGSNAYKPTTEERVRINGKMQLEDLSNGFSGGNQDTKTTDVEDEKDEKIERSKKVRNIGKACQELAVFTRENALKTSSLVDENEDEDLEENIRENFYENRPLAMIQKDISKRKMGHKTDFKKRLLENANSLVFSADKDLTGSATSAPTKKKPKVQEKEASTFPKKTTTKKRKMIDKVVYTGTLDMVVKEEEEEEKVAGVFMSQGSYNVNFALPYFPKSSNDARNKVRESLRIFQAICRKITQNEESKTDESRSDEAIRRVDLAAKAVMEARNQSPVLGKKTFGPIPGVEVGDEFLYRVELALVGVHRVLQGGIDFVKLGKTFFAVSVVASGGYDNEINKPDCLMYSGAGGVGRDKSIGNQKLERGNLALSNNIESKYPVRVIRGYKVKSAESSDSKSKISTMYIYDGLYMVDKCIQVTGPLGNLVYKFELNRIPGQPQLAIREVTSKKFKTRPGIIVNDITDGKEVTRISAINTIDAEKPPLFTYITKIVYPDWYKPVPPKGCDCVGRCSDKKCSCALKNGGEIPYNRNGAIVEAKTLVYECGPSCGCPPSCYNRVTQHGMKKIPLEIFKTETRGWGVRSLSSISSGSFICEYIGELLEDTEAEKRTSNDEYLFDIGQNYNDCNPNPNPDPVMDDSEEMGGFTIDALKYGNVGRFINHSCSPNLYAQNVLYDQEDKRMPHIMLFAAENIPPLQELTYHYNYKVDTVTDSDGNIKVKNCYCGSAECTGRLY